MLFLAYRSLRARPARTVFTALAIALGVGMIFAMRIVGVTIEESARAARESRLSGADLEVSGANGAKFPDARAETLAARPEVELAAPILRGAEGVVVPDPSVTIGGVALKGTGLALLGVDPARRLSPFDLAAGSFFSAPDAFELLLPAQWAALNGLGVDSEIELITGPNAQKHTYRVVGLLKSESVGAPTPTAWLPLQTMQTSFDAPGQASAVLVRLKPGVNKDTARDELQAALGTQFVVVSTTGGGGLNSFFNLTRLALPFSGFIVLLAGAFLVFNAFAITLAERRREIGQLRTLGMTRGQVMAQTLMEAALTALFGSAMGLLFGGGLGRGVTLAIQTLQGRGSVPDAPIPVDGMFLALGAGLAVTLGVTISLAFQAGRVSALEALQTERGRAASPSRLHKWLFGLTAALLVATVVLAARAQSVSQESLSPSYAPIFLPMGTLLAAALCFLPLWVNGFIRLGEAISRSRTFSSPGGVRAGVGVAAQLAVSSLGRQRMRAALTAITLTLGLMIIIALSGITFLLRNFLLSANTSLLRADFGLVRPFPPGTSFEEFTRLPSPPPIPTDLQADIDALNDVAEVAYFTNVSLPGIGVESGMGDQYSFGMNYGQLREGAALFPIAEGSWEAAENYFASGPAIFLPELTARRLNKHPGDAIELDTVLGKVPFTVAAVGGGYPVVMTDIAQQYFGAYPFAILINAKPGVNKAALEERVRAIQEKYPAEVAPLNTETLQAAVDNLTGPMVALFGGLTSLSGIVAALGIVVTLVASVLERQREIGTLRAIGMSRAHIRGMIVLEAGLLGLAGASLGALAGLGLAYVFAKLLIESVAAIAGIRPVSDPPIPWGVAAIALLTGPAMAMLAALWPADRAASVNPAEAMRAEGATGFLPPAKHLGPTGLRGLVARMPLSARLSLGLGFVFIVTVAALTAVRVNYERRLLEDNAMSLIARQLDFMAQSNRAQFGDVELNELSPQSLAALFQKAGVQLEAIQTQFQGSGSPYEFGLKYFVIANTQNRVIFSDQAEFTGRTLTDTVALSGSSSAVRLIEWKGERVFEATLPIENSAGKRLGYGRLAVSAEPVDNLIRDIVVSSLWTMAAALAIAVSLTILFTRRALAPITQIAEVSRAVARGDLTQRVPETRWDEVGALARAFNEMVAGLNERERMRDLFGRYLSREVGEAVLKGRVTFKGERKIITVLYCDMRGSTTFAEQHAPEDVMAALNEYFEVVILAVEAQGGIVNRFVGDETVCVFGAPTEYRDHADRAVQAALGIRAGFAYLNDKRARLGQPTLRFGIGLNTGEVVAGATGSEERQEYTLIGDAMNVGARIEQLNKTFPDHDILLSEFTRAALGGNADAYALTDLGEAEVRGKSQPVRVWGVEV
jgi:putative ABC transport system permease protein